MPVASLKYPKRAAPPDAGRSGAVADLTRGGGATFIDTTITAFGFPPHVRLTHHVGTGEQEAFGFGASHAPGEHASHEQEEGEGRAEQLHSATSTAGGQHDHVIA